MVELKEKAPWMWESRLVVNDLTELDHFYAVPGNAEKLWTPEPTLARMTVTAPRMLALPPDCVAFCAKEQRTPYDLATYVQHLLGMGHLDVTKYSLMLDWCCMVAQAEPTTGDTQKSSMVAFPVTAIIGSMALHKWATSRLAFTLGSPIQPLRGAPAMREHRNQQELAPPTPPAAPPQLDVSLVAQVTATVMAALRANGGGMGTAPHEEPTRQTDDSKPYSTFQLAKLKGFCCVLDNGDIPPIWDYFRSTKDVDAHRTKLLE